MAVETCFKVFLRTLIYQQKRRKSSTSLSIMEEKKKNKTYVEKDRKVSHNLKSSKYTLVLLQLFKKIGRNHPTLNMQSLKYISPPEHKESDHRGPKLTF